MHGTVVSIQTSIVSHPETHRVVYESVEKVLDKKNMKTYTQTEIDELVKGRTIHHDELQGMIIHTRIYLWRDGSYRDEPDWKTIEANNPV